MKYIRTKDELGILIEPMDNEELQKLKVGVNDMIFSTWYGNNRDNIVKQANTIEELIDVYILKDTETGYCGVMSKETMKHSINPGTAYGREFYGAIWVIDENGIPTLTPVAKINEKGELELL